MVECTITEKAPALDAVPVLHAENGWVVFRCERLRGWQEEWVFARGDSWEHYSAPRGPKGEYAEESTMSAVYESASEVAIEMIARLSETATIDGLKRIRDEIVTRRQFEDLAEFLGTYMGDPHEICQAYLDNRDYDRTIMSEGAAHPPTHYTMRDAIEKFVVGAIEDAKKKIGVKANA